MSSQKTTFNIEDAKELRDQLVQMRQFLRAEWQGVSSQARSLRMTWHDLYQSVFDEYYLKMIEAPYAGVERELDQYISFVDNQIRIAEEIKSRVGSL